MAPQITPERLDAIRARDYPASAADTIIRELLSEVDRLYARQASPQDGERRTFILRGTEWDSSGTFRSGEQVEAEYDSEWDAWAIGDSEYYLHTPDNDAYREWGGDVIDPSDD